MSTSWFFKKVHGAVSLGLILFGAVTPQALAAKTVEQRLEELEQEIRLLKRQQEVEKEVKLKKETEAPVLSVSQDGFNVKSKDQAFVLKFRGQAQTDMRYFIDDNTPAGSNTFLIRRLRPTLEGTVFKHWDFRLMPDFAGSQVVLQDAWVDFKYWKAAQLRVGKFKSPIGIERLQADAAGQFIETALSTNLVPNRDIGIDLHGEFLDGTITYDAGIFNGVADGGSGDTDIHDDKEFVASIFTQPFKNSSHDSLNGLGIGIAGSAGTNHGSTLPTYRSGGQQSIFSYLAAVRGKGDRMRIAPQAYYYYGQLGVLEEYVLTSQELQNGAVGAKAEHYGWQLASTYVLTGESAAYTGVVPRNAFDPNKGKWGALEVAARLSSLSIDDSIFPTFANPASAVTGAAAWDIGLNWYLNKNIKHMTHFEQTLFESGGALGGDRPTENALLSRLQVYF